MTADYFTNNPSARDNILAAAEKVPQQYFELMMRVRQEASVRDVVREWANLLEETARRQREALTDPEWGQENVIESMARNGALR